MVGAAVGVSIQDAPAPRETGRLFTSASPRGTPAASGDPSVGGFFAWTLVVLGLIAAATFVLRRAMKSSSLFRGQGPIQVLGRRSIGPRQDLVLVEIGPRVLLIGATRDHLSLLGEFGASASAAAGPVPPEMPEHRLAEALAQS